MGTTQPIRTKEELKKFTDYYKTSKNNPRNYALIVFGLHTALRISDILEIRWKEVYDFEQQTFQKYLGLKEHKTGKYTNIALNPHIIEALLVLKEQTTPEPEHCLFCKSTMPDVPLSRSQAYRIVKEASENSLHKSNISCHSLRKTFGYHAWKQGTQPALLMDIFNHSSYQITKRYLGIGQDEKDSVYMNIDL
ncbi:MAG: tyrosine-type recombinase/integrase [Agathobacter sp.]|nr:tyrosine-type recombinase/integrase [Agathobacter sp.]